MGRTDTRRVRLLTSFPIHRDRIYIGRKGHKIDFGFMYIGYPTADPT